jgi:hypothetical protein
MFTGELFVEKMKESADAFGTTVGKLEATIDEYFERFIANPDKYQGNREKLETLADGGIHSNKIDEARELAKSVKAYEFL